MVTVTSLQINKSKNIPFIPPLWSQMYLYVGRRRHACYLYICWRWFRLGLCENHVARFQTWCVCALDKVRTHIFCSKRFHNGESQLLKRQIILPAYNPLQGLLILSYPFMHRWHPFAHSSQNSSGNPRLAGWWYCVLLLKIKSQWGVLGGVWRFHLVSHGGREIRGNLKILSWKPITNKPRIG